jgi:cyanophycinase
MTGASQKRFRGRRRPDPSGYLPLALALAFLSGFAARAAENPSPARGTLVVIGGGTIPAEIRQRTAELAGGPTAKAVVIPFASQGSAAGENSAQPLREVGLTNVTVLTTNDTGAACAALKDADLIWLGGGEQERLVSTLRRLDLIESIRIRHAQGAVVAGTSAGAAAMSRVMIAGGGKSPDEPPRITEGLGLWPEVMVDQHFAERSRAPRLRRAVALHPDLTAVGIDESTAAVVRGGEFEVIGRNNVRVIRARTSGDSEAPGLDETLLRPGERFTTGGGRAPER